MPYDTRSPAVSVSSDLRWRRFTAFAVVTLALFRIVHARILWADEDYHLAAAIDILHGLIPYKDFWYDKPPLAAAYYLLTGGFPGFPLRLLDAAYVVLCAFLVYRLARALWSEREGLLAALLFAFFLTFYLPSAVLPFAADALMIGPHLAAIYCAQRARPLAAGLWAGVAFLVNTKALFVLAACAVWVFPALLPLLAGFAVFPTVAAALAIFSGAWSGYVEQVWRWGFAYAAGTPELHPYRNGLVRTLDWSFFHAALVLGAVIAFVRGRQHTVQLAAWLALSFAGVAMGKRFEPRYFLQLLPPLVVIAARGLLLFVDTQRRLAAIVCMLLLLIPLLRFGPRYVYLAADSLAGRQPKWADVLIDEDSRQVAAKLKTFAQPGDTLLVWGYRPGIYVYTRLLPASLFWDSQPLTGVAADRHLHSSVPIYAGPARANRRELTRSHPTFLVDSLSIYNPALRPEAYPELHAWLADYREVARTSTSIIYARQGH